MFLKISWLIYFVTYCDLTIKRSDKTKTKLVKQIPVLQDTLLNCKKMLESRNECHLNLKTCYFSFR